MASFPLSDINKVNAHPAKGMTWSKSAIIVKRLAFPKGAIPPHLRPYTERFTSAARTCRNAMAGKTGAQKVIAFNSCISAELGGRGRG